MNHKYFIAILSIALWISIQPFLNKIIFRFSDQKISSNFLTYASISIRLIWDLYYIYNKTGKITNIEQSHRNYIYYMLFLIIIFSQTMIDNVVNSKFDTFFNESSVSVTYIQSATILITYLLTQINNIKRYDIIGIISICIGAYILVN